MIVNEILTNEQKANDDLSSASHSVNLINELISNNNYTAANASKDVLETIDRNYRHIEIVLQRDHVISNSSQDLTTFYTAAESGKNYIIAGNNANNVNALGILIN